MDANELLGELVDKQAADIFIIAGRPLSYKKGKNIVALNDHVLIPGDTENLITQIYALAEKRSMAEITNYGDDDFSFAIKGVSRFRVNTYKQRGSLAAVIRIVAFNLPDPTSLHIPPEVMRLADLRSGLMLVTGPAGSGKTTTLACIIDRVNKTRNDHIITLENPIEFLHRHDKSLISQREINIDTKDYAKALRASLRESPNVILIGELRDPETISIALTAAETGHVVYSTLHTVGAVNTVDRLVDSFPAEQQAQARLQLSMVLQSVVSQQLIPTLQGDMRPVFEIMNSTSAIRNMIREGRTHQMSTVINTSAAEGMISMDASLLALYKEDIISAQEMLTHALAPEALAKQAGI